MKIEADRCRKGLSEAISSPDAEGSVREAARTRLLYIAHEICANGITLPTGLECLGYVRRLSVT